MFTQSEGLLVECAISNLSLNGLSGMIGMRAGLVIEVEQSRVITGTILKTESEGVKVGDILANGSTLLGQSLSFPSCVSEIKVEKVVRVESDKLSDAVKVVLALTVCTSTPKIKGGGIKGSAMNNPMLDGLMEELDIDFLFVGETIKSAMATVNLFANTTGIEVELGKVEGDAKYGMSDEVYAQYTNWIADNTHSHTISLPVSSLLVKYVEEAGMSAENGIATVQFEYIKGQMVVGIESPVTELRATKSSPNMLMLLEWANKNGFVNPGVVGTVDYSQAPALKGSDIEALKDMTIAQIIAKLAKLYPNGAKIGNGGAYVSSLGGQVDPANCLVDFKAMKQNGNGDDAMSIALKEIIVLKSEQNKVLSAFQSGLVAWTMLRDVTEELGVAINFFQSACHSYVVNGGLLKKLFKASQDSVVLTARAFPHLEEMVVWVNEETATKFELVEGGRYLLNRQPTPNYANVELRIDDSLPYGIALMSDWSMQVTNWGDVDGDQINLTSVEDMASSYARNHYERDVVTRMALMVLANQGQFAEASEGIKPSKFNHSLPNVESNDIARCEELYLRHSGIKGSNLVSFMTMPKMSKFAWVNGTTGLLDVNSIRPEDENVGALEAFVDYNCGFVGKAYAMEFNLGILKCLAPNGKSINNAYAIALSLYEDKSLGGYNSKDWWLWQAAKSGFVGKNDKGQRDEKLLNLACELSTTYKVTAKEVEMIFMAGAMQGCFSNDSEGHWNAMIGNDMDWSQYVPLAKMFRGLSSGNTNLIISPDEFEAAIALIPEGSPLRLIADCIAPIYPLLSLLGGSEGEEE